MARNNQNPARKWMECHDPIICNFRNLTRKSPARSRHTTRVNAPMLLRPVRPSTELVVDPLARPTDKAFKYTSCTPTSNALRKPCHELATRTMLSNSGRCKTRCHLNTSIPLALGHFDTETNLGESAALSIPQRRSAHSPGYPMETGEPTAVGILKE